MSVQHFHVRCNSSHKLGIQLTYRQHSHKQAVAPMPVSYILLVMLLAMRCIHMVAIGFYDSRSKAEIGLRLQHVLSIY